MLLNIIEYSVQNPEVKENVKEGTASLVGLSEMEHMAVNYTWICWQNR